ncbi:hypothetical protein KPL71_026412 [Citrus sinensis]|uniref:Uncharacterized protein n=1 Tax=Citrus sinensis TaxID=2711 RepID=A0ACB8HZD2_CITSI|nr:hypothetical protein KPL71_026412 [Citrus sinensis]
MASTSSSTSSNHVTLSSNLSLPKSCTSHTANKIENLLEYSYIPESAQISESSYPLLSPYQLYKLPSSFTRSIRTLISTRRPHPKEYIQSSRLDQCSLQATPAEQYVTLEIPLELISNWKREGYTHLHLGGIRLILTLHGRKGLPVTARLAMLDTQFKQYQDAVIGTVLTTLHAGSVLLTFYPNFNLSLQDPNLPTTLKVQVQIQGAEQISSAKIATLHHQLVYRLQNHALDLPTPERHSDTLMFHNNTAPIQTSESMFERRQDGTVRMTFKPPPSAPQEPPRLSFTFSSMITAVQTAQEDLPITGFNSEGYPVYPAKHNGHFLWDAPGSGMCDPNCPCWDDWEEDYDYATTRKKKPKKKKPPVPYHHCDPKPPSDPPPPPAPLPIYRKELKWIAKHCKSEIPSPLSHPTPIVQPLACMMFSSTSSDYSSSFPPLEPHTDSQRNVVSKPFVPSPITSTGHLEPPKPFESVLNWQTQNARAQNDTLLHLNSNVENISLRTEQIETKVDSITAQMQQIHQNLHSRIGQLDSKLRAMLAHRYSGSEFDQKEREIRRLKAELAQIESEKQRPTLFTTSPPIPSIGPTYHPFASMLSPIKQYDPSKLFGMTHTLFRDNPLPPPPKPKPKPRPQPRPAPLHPSSLTIPGQPSPSSTPASPLAPLSVPIQSKDKEPMNQFTAHTVTHSSTTDGQTSDSNLAVSDSPTETDTESSASTNDSEKSYADITKILMAQPDPPTQGQTSHTEPYVDIPSEVEEEMHESSATNHPSPAQTNPCSQKSSNGPWFTFDDLPSHKWRDRLNEMSAWIDLQMLRTGATTQSVLREFATRFTGALRDWFDSLGQYRQLQFVDLPEVSSALAVLHDQFLGDPSAAFEAARRDYLNMKCCSLNAKDLDFHYKRMSLLFYKLNGFNEPTLKHIKCHKKKDCDCSSKKKRHFQKFKTPEFSSKPHRSRKPYRFFRKKSSSSREFKRKQSSRCFICKRKGYYAKDCPNKREKSIRLVEHLQATTDYSPAKDELEFYFSEQDEPNDETMFALQSSSDSDSDQSQVIFHQLLLSLDTTVPIPSIKLQILPSKFQRPIPAIGLIDTSAQRSMLNPHILPSEYWTQSEEHFKAVNGKLFTTSLITKKPISIQIFPNCVIWTKVIGSTLPNKDILLGFDILHQIKHLQIIPTGIRVKSMFKPFTDILKLYNLSETPQSYQDISTKLLSFCPESHSEFTHPNPLWKNKSLFIKLPFKLNDDINPTKATHPGMSHSDLLLAQQECSQLLAQGSHDEHRQLLTQFYDILQSHGIMLSAKKRTIATNNIEFLGMVIKDGHYQPGKHIAQELLHFPDQQLSKRQIQQFLGNINYIRDFIPHVDHYTHHLSALLKKKPPEWNADHTIAVTTLKQIAQNPPPLKLITDGQRILQTDASDESWGAILLEELNDKEHFIAYASGHFSDTQKHYHSVFKEILADSQDPWEDFLPLSQHLHQFPQPTMDEPGPSEPGSSSQPSKADKATQMPSPKSQPSPSKPGYRRDCPYPPCRGPNYFRRRENFLFMASTSSSNPSTPVTLSSTLSLPKSCTSHTAKQNGHFLWDAPGSGMCDPTCPCWDDWDDDDDYATTRKKKPKKKKPPIPCHHCDPKPPSDPPPPPAPLPIYRKELKWIAKHCKSEIPSLLSHPTPIVQPLACMMFSSTPSDYSSSFPPLEPHTDSQRNVVSKPFVPSSITSTGQLEPPKPFESVLNWQTQNARAQNDTLLHLNSKVENISLRTEQIETKLFGMTHTLFRDNPLPPPPKPKPKPKPQPRPAPLHPSSLTIPGQPSPSSTPASPLAPLSVPTQSKDKEPMNQFTAHTVTHSSTIDDPTSDSILAVSDSPTKTDIESSASTSDSERSYANITKILMAQPDPTTQGQTSHTEPYVDIPSKVEEEMHESSARNHPPPAQTNPSSQKSSNGPWFTFDDLPSHKWRDRLNEMSAWIDLQMLRPGATTQSFVDLPEVSSALAVLHDQFLGDPSAVFEAARRDYLNMKCCSLNAKDLDFHYNSNATRKRIAIAIQRRNGIFRNSKLQNFHPNLADPESPTGSSERNLPPPENSNESNQADVSSAKEKATMPKIVPTKEKNPSDEPNDETMFALQNSSDLDSDQPQKSSQRVRTAQHL